MFTYSDGQKDFENSIFEFLPTLECTGGWFCCTFYNRCPEGEGDCNYNWDCEHGLVCGTNNCKGFDSAEADCCERRGDL